MRVRLAVYALIACVASTLQFDQFDCNGARPLSFVAGALAIFMALLVIDRVWVTSVSARTVRARLVLATAIVVVGGGVVWGLGWLTWITHMCG